MSPPITNGLENSTNQLPPYRLEIGAGYSHIDLGGEAPSYSGPHYQIRLGQNFNIDPRHSLFINGVFRQAFLSSSDSSSGGDLSMLHFGIEGGYEAWLAPEILSGFLFLGLGTNVFYSEDLGTSGETAVPLDNQAAMAFSLGGGFSLGQGILVFSGSFQPSFGLQATPDYEFGSPQGYNPIGFTLHAGLDLAKLTNLAGGKFAPPNLDHFGEGLRIGILTEGSYTYNFGEPDSGENTLRIFDTVNDRPMFNLAQFSLVRETDEESPVGFGLVFDAGENPGVSAANESISGDYYDLQQAWGEIRLPIGNGLTLRGGKIATIIGLEVIEPTNNQISRSWGFGLAIPFTHIGALATYCVSEEVCLKLGGVNGWDNVLGHDSGLTALGGITFEPSDSFSGSVTGSVGEELGRLRTVIDSILTFTTGDFSMALNFDWGHEGEGGPEGLPPANWMAASLNPRYNFHHHFGVSGRAEIFYDPEGARTGASQTLGSGALTLHFRPVPEKHYRYFPLELRTELRHDLSSADSFFSGADPSSKQTTFAINATLNYENFIGLTHSSP